MRLLLVLVTATLAHGHGHANPYVSAKDRAQVACQCRGRHTATAATAATALHALPAPTLRSRPVLELRGGNIVTVLAKRAARDLELEARADTRLSAVCLFRMSVGTWLMFQPAVLFGLATEPVVRCTLHPLPPRPHRPPRTPEVPSNPFQSLPILQTPANLFHPLHPTHPAARAKTWHSFSMSHSFTRDCCTSWCGRSTSLTRPARTAIDCASVVGSWAASWRVKSWHIGLGIGTTRPLAPCGGACRWASPSAWSWRGR